MAANARALVAGTALIAAGATLVVSAVSAIPFGFRSPSAHAAIETAASVVAIVAAYLMLGRFRATQRYDDLVLVVALTVLGLTNAFTTALALTGAESGSFATWGSLAGRLAGAAIFAIAAFSPARRVAAPRRALARAGAVALAVLCGAAFVGVLGANFSLGLDPELSPQANDPRIVGSPGLLTTQLLATALYTAAAIGLMLRAERTRDDLIAWFAVGTTLAAFSRLNYFIFPSIFSNYVFTGDVLRFLFYVALLIGTLRAIAAYQRAATQAAVADERRRMAREIHDGLAQELAYISTESRALADSAAAPAAALLASAAERALDESRDVISELAHKRQRKLGEAIADAAEVVAERAGVRLDVELNDGLEVDPEAQLALVRIVREAVTNAVRHGGADHVQLTLDVGGDEVLLAVEDDGCGFDAEIARASGFGLTSMRERANALGGRLTIASRPDSGTRVEIWLPRSNPSGS